MSRRNAADKREVLPDPIYNSTVVTKLINQIMLDGKRGIAQNIVYDAFEVIREKLDLDAMEVFNQTIENIKPLLETKPRRVGGATYQVPMEIRPDRRQTLAIRWLVLFARKRSGEKEMHRKLAAEIIDAYNNSGGAVKRKEEMHRTAEANKAFAHYKW